MHITIPVTLFAEIAADKVAIANARIRDIHLKNAAHGSDGWNATARRWTRCGDNCGTWSLESVNASRARANAEVAAAAADFAAYMADIAHNAAMLANAADPLPYSSDHGYISQSR